MKLLGMDPAGHINLNRTLVDYKTKVRWMLLTGAEERFMLGVPSAYRQCVYCGGHYAGYDFVIPR